jgi:CHAT domain-containing protein
MLPAGVVHYAGHALFDDARPTQSALLLAAAPTGRESGTLTASKIAQLELKGTPLVVLSACETSRPRSDARGFAGLTEAFLAAGAKGVVGSLWRVNDEPTRQLMVVFHQRFSESGDGPGALRNAQLALLNNSEKFPFAWAAFRYAGL